MTTRSASPTTVPPAAVAIEAIRSRFPALARHHAGKPVAYFDGPGGTQVPHDVVEAMADYLYHHNANTHWHYPTSAETDAALARAREALADFFNASPREIAFGNNMTTLTFHLSRALGRNWGPGDEIVVTELDHHANVASWRALARERGVTIRSVPFNLETGELSWPDLKRAVNPRTRLLAIGAASNALGTIPPVRDAAQLAHSKGALCFVDAVHYAAHRLIDVQAMQCDFLVCSPYKFYGPHAGVLYGRADVTSGLDVPKLEPAPDEIPDRLETGTQNHEGIVGSAAAVDFLASLSTDLTLSPSEGERARVRGPFSPSPGATRRQRLIASMSALHASGEALFARLWEGLSAINGVRCYGPPPGRPRTPTVSFTIAGVPSAEVARSLAQQAIFASNGNFYAATVVERLGHARDGLVRAGCACYTTQEEIERLIEAVRQIAAR